MIQESHTFTLYRSQKSPTLLLFQEKEEFMQMMCDIFLAREGDEWTTNGEAIITAAS